MVRHQTDSVKHICYNIDVACTLLYPGTTRYKCIGSSNFNVPVKGWKGQHT